MHKWWRFGAISMVLIALVVAAIWQTRHFTVETPPAIVAPVAIEPITPVVSAPEFYRDIKPIFDKRCVVCHAGYDAPCQLTLDSPEGLQRGATRALVYDSKRKTAAEPTRLFIDVPAGAQSTDAWRARHFFPVLNTGERDAQNDLGNSLLHRMLTLKAEHPLPDGRLPAALDTSRNRKAFCPSNDDFDRYAKERPLHGMPYGLPALSDDEFTRITRWLEAGANIAAAPPLSSAAQKEIAEWERFLNRNDARSQLMARYIYEHLFLADIYFSNSDTREFFRLVRSRTAPGDPVDVIATRKPFDDPQVKRVYYRLQPHRATIAAKTHLPYALNLQRMQRWQQLFLQSDYAVKALPHYAADISANPFVTFAAIPLQVRYRFLLDDAYFFMAAVVKGPAFRDWLALDVVQDQFWVMFISPDSEAMVDSDFLARASNGLSLPDEPENRSPASGWKKYADLQAEYVAAREHYLTEKFPNPPAATLDLIWNGQGGNQSGRNAALTVFRHVDSASVVPGFVEPMPGTAWVLDYPLFERLYYLLAAGFDVYGDTDQQLLTRVYLDFLRMESETNFLQFLPKSAREKTRNAWYQGVSAKFRDSVYRKTDAYQRESGIHYRSKNPQREFFDLLRARLGPALSHRHDLADAELAEPLQAALQKVAKLRGAAVARLPETILLRVIIRNEPDRIFTLIHNDDRSNVAMPMSTQNRRRPARDTLSVVPGIVGAYPNAFWVVHEDDLPRLARSLANIRNAADYRAVAARFAVSRNGARFWQEGDWALNTYRNLELIEWGILDYSRYER